MKNKNLETMRHSCSHVLAAAVLKLFPKTKPGIGPAIKNGFYYDFEFDKPISEESLGRISASMVQIIKAKTPFKKELVSIKRAQEIFKNQPYKLELIKDLASEGKKNVTLYQTGDFIDLCEGPHLTETGKIGIFKLTHLAGAYWRGSEKRPMLTRIYGTCFPTQKELDQYLKKVEEIKKRDHRRLGKELDLYSVSEEVGPGLVLWHPKGALIRTILEDYWRKKHQEGGYQFVFTPHIGRSLLWEKSGHLKWYQENMYSPMDVEGDKYYLKPMNCPFHMMIYNSRTRSYRDLPLRLAELGTVYRYERSGVLHGMTRVRGFTQDDAHIFCTPEQIEEEISRTLKFCLDFLKVFGLPMSAELSVRDPAAPKKYAGSDKDWEKAEAVLVKALKTNKVEYKRMEGEAVFYGPKIDLKAYDALERPWQTSTIQFDFNIPERFNLNFINKKGKKQAPYVIHRALYGSHERFFPILIEHYAGAFPIWLSPVQIKIIPIAKRHQKYAQGIAEKLEKEDLRVEVSDHKGTMEAKIRDGELEKIPYMLVVGDKEIKTKSLAVRSRGEKDLGKMALEKFLARIKSEIENKA